MTSEILRTRKQKFREEKISNERSTRRGVQVGAVRFSFHPRERGWGQARRLFSLSSLSPLDPDKIQMSERGRCEFVDVVRTFLIFSASSLGIMMVSNKR